MAVAVWLSKLIIEDGGPVVSGLGYWEDKADGSRLFCDRNRLPNAVPTPAKRLRVVELCQDGCDGLLLVADIKPHKPEGRQVPWFVSNRLARKSKRGHTPNPPALFDPFTSGFWFVRRNDDFVALDGAEEFG